MPSLQWPVLCPWGGGAAGGWRCLPEGHRLYRLSSAISSLAAGIRGGIFTLVFARLNIRLRNCLFRSLVSQETSFFDENRTGWSLLGPLGVQGELVSCGARQQHGLPHQHFLWSSSGWSPGILSCLVAFWCVSWGHHRTLARPLELSAVTKASLVL